MDTFWMKLARPVRYAWLRIVRIKAPAESVALGLAVGVFVGALPFLSLQMFLAVSVALLLRGNPVAAALGTWWSNPLNWAIIFPLFYMLGKLFIPGPVVEVSIHELIHMPIMDLLHRGGKWILITTLGGAIAGLPLAVLTYFLSLRGVRLYHDSRARRKRERQSRALHKRR